MVHPLITEDGRTLFVTGHHFLNWVKEKYGFENALYIAQHFDWLRMAEANNRPELRQKAIAGLETKLRYIILLLMMKNPRILDRSRLWITRQLQR